METTLSFFPTPFPNEDFRSIFYRYHLSSLNAEIIDTNMYLVGIRNNFSVFPKSLIRLLEKLPDTKYISVDSIVSKNTLLPAFLPFIPDYYHRKILNEIEKGRSGEDSYAGKLAGNKYGKNISELIKYCPVCIEEDLINLGCSYIHRDHQYAFINMCSKHSNILITHCIECDVELGFSPLIEKCKNGHLQNNKHSNEHINENDIQKNILKDLEFILNNPEKIRRWEIDLRFLEHLNTKGYVSKTDNNIMIKKLANDFNEYYPKEIIKDFGLDNQYLSQYNTMEKIFRSTQLVVNLPLTLLFIHFLTGSIENFLKQSAPYVCEIPFGIGPWSCQNKLCPKYNQYVIHKCEKSYKSGVFKVRFMCSFCDAGYVENWCFSGQKEQRNQKKILHSDKKIDKIIYFWQSGLSINEISNKLYCSNYSVKNVVKQFNQGCNLKQIISFRETAVSIDKDKIRKNKDKHRNKLLAVLEDSKNLTRSGIKSKCKASYNWLQKHDNQWLEKRLPPSKTTGKFNDRKSFLLNRSKYRARLIEVLKANKGSMRSEIVKKCKVAYDWLRKNDLEWMDKHLPPSKSRVKFDWDEVDRTLAIRIKEVSRELIESNPNTRVARYSIMGELTTKERGRIKSYLHHLPITNQALTEFAETKEQYQIRHLPALVQQLRTHYNYDKVTLDTIMSYRRSYRGISDEMIEILTDKLIELN